MALYQIQQEILKYMQGQQADPEILPEKSQDELSVYYSLVVSSLSSLMKNVYPLCYKILEPDWDEVMIQYQNKYPSKSAIYNKLAADFHKLLAEPEFSKYPNYLSDLALHEWTDLLTFNSPHKEASTKVAPVHEIVRFNYPVSQISQYLKNTEDDLEEIRQTDIEEQAEIMFFYRDEKSQQNRSFALSETSLFVIEAIGSGKGLEQIHQEFNAHFGLEVSIEAIQKLIEDLQVANILLD